MCCSPASAPCRIAAGHGFRFQFPERGGDSGRLRAWLNPCRTHEARAAPAEALGCLAAVTAAAWPMPRRNGCGGRLPQPTAGGIIGVLLGLYVCSVAAGEHGRPAVLSPICGPRLSGGAGPPDWANLLPSCRNPGHRLGATRLAMPLGIRVTRPPTSTTSTSIRTSQTKDHGPRPCSCWAASRRAHHQEASTPRRKHPHFLHF